MLLEVCAYNIQSCFIAEKAGAGRIELCADPAAGGTTPGYGIIRYVLEHMSIPVFPMIRPRGGNFIYDTDELAIMKEDILICRELGCPGIVAGILLPDGQIDTVNMSRVTEWAYPMSVTCHKAFDRTANAFQALEAIISAGCSRVLTSGHQPAAIEGITMLSKLISQAAGRIIIMPGGGVRSTNIAQLVTGLGAIEYHSSGIITKDGNYIADEHEIRAMASVEKIIK